MVLTVLYYLCNSVHLSAANNSLWGATYKSEQKTQAGFVSAFDKNIIRLVGVQKARDSAKVFL